MIRSIKITLSVLALLVVVVVSFAGGQHLRRIAAGPILERQRVSSLDATGLADSGARAADPADDPADTFLDVLHYVNSDYVDRIADDSKLGFGAVRTMLVSLDDPKTRFYDPEQRKQLESQMAGDFTGIGAAVAVTKQKKGDIDERRLTVIAPVPGGPADKAGVQPGDFITEIDKHWVIAYDPRLDLDRLHTKNMDEKQYRQAYKDATQRLTDGISLTKALEQINGTDGMALSLTIERPGSAAPLTISVATASTTLDPVEYRGMKGDVGYLRVSQFNDKATDEFSRALADNKPRKLIVDLRDNFGGPVTTAQSGVLNSALALLGRLTRGGTIAEVQRRAGKPENVTTAATGAPPGSLVVIVNGGTSNVAEVVASALKDKAGAKVVGSATFGDTVLQKLVPLRGGAAMTLTSGRLLTSRGIDLAGKGLRPDVAVAAAGPSGSDDQAIQRAVSVLVGA